jgi:hypothetical protein
MNSMPDFYGQPYPNMDQQSIDGSGYPQQDANMANLDSEMVGQSQTLDQIFFQNNEEMMRRRSNYNPQNYNANGHGARERRASMMEFGTSDLADFQFDPNPAPPQISQQLSNMMPANKPLDPRRVRSKEELALNTQFAPMSNDYAMASSVPTYSAGVMGAQNDPSNFMSPNINMDMDFEQMARESAPMNMNPALSQQMYTGSPMSATFPAASYAPSNHDPGGGMTSPQTPMHSSRTPHSTGAAPQNFLNQKFRRNNTAPMNPSPLSMSGPAHATSVMPSPMHMQSSMSRRDSLDGQSPYPHHANSKLVNSSVSASLTRCSGHDHGSNESDALGAWSQ